MIAVAATMLVAAAGRYLASTIGLIRPPHDDAYLAGPLDPFGPGLSRDGFERGGLPYDTAAITRRMESSGARADIRRPRATLAPAARPAPSPQPAEPSVTTGS